jgi:hypothetical protein
MTPRTRLAGFLAAAALIAALAGCGSSGGDVTFPRPVADTLIADLNGVQAAAAQGDCTTAQARADTFISHVNSLPANIGPDAAEVKTALRNAALHLKDLTADPSQCSTGASGQTGPATTSSTTPTTTTSPSTTTTTETATTTSTSEHPPPDQGGGNGGGKPGGGGTGGTGTP